VGLVSDATIRNMEISEMAEANAQKFAEWKEKEGAKHKELNTALLEAEERLAAAKQGALNTETQKVLLTREVLDLEEKIKVAGEFTLEGKKLRVDLLEKEAELAKVTAKIEDESAKASAKAADEKKKADEEKIKAAEDYAKAIALSVEEEVELARLTLKAKENVDTMTRAEKDQLEILRLKKEEKANTLQIETLLKRGVENLSTEELKQLDTLAKANGVIEKRITDLQPKIIENVQDEAQASTQLLSITKAIADEEERRMNAIEQSRRIKAATIGDASGLSNYELRRQIRSIGSELKVAQAANQGGSITGNLSAAELVLYSNMKALEGELRKRETKASSEENSKLYDAVLQQGGTVAEAMKAANFPELYERQKRMEDATLTMTQQLTAIGTKQADQQARDDAAQNGLLTQMNENLRVIRTQLGNGGLDEARKY
jgi:hypothetical protein